MVEISSLVQKTGDDALAKAEGVHGELLEGVEKGKQADVARYDEIIQRIEVLEKRKLIIFYDQLFPKTNTTLTFYQIRPFSKIQYILLFIVEDLL